MKISLELLTGFAFVGLLVAAALEGFSEAVGPWLASPASSTVIVEPAP